MKKISIIKIAAIIFLLLSLDIFIASCDTADTKLPDDSATESESASETEKNPESESESESAKETPAETESVYDSSISVTLNGIDLTEFKIAAKKSDADTENAEKLVRFFSKYNGYKIPVVTFDKLTGEEAGVFCLGSYTRDGKKSAKGTTYRVEISVDDGEYTAGFLGNSDDNYTLAVDEYLAAVKADENGKKISLTLPTETMVEYTYKFTLKNSAQWKLIESKTVEKEVAKGITYREYYFKGSDGNPYKANVLFIKSKYYEFRLGTPGDEPNRFPEYRQTVPDQMKEALKNGFEAVVAVNGSLWANNTPQGLSMKNGKILSRGDPGWAYFALKKDGTYEIAELTSATKTKDIKMAVGGPFLLIKDGKPQSMPNVEHCSSRHPRTDIGITASGDIILSVIDGRAANAGISSGATLENCADLMLRLGAYSAVSIDGGGSTCMIIKEGDEYKTMNNPSDGGLRSTVNSTLIIKKEVKE